MKAWMLLLLPLVCCLSTGAGNLTVSNLTIYPAVKGSFNCLLYFSFSPLFPLPRQSILQLNSSNLKFNVAVNREDCFITGVPGVFASSCNSSDTLLSVRLDSLNVTEITSSMNLSLTVTNALDLITEETQAKFTVETTWDDALINRNASLAPVAIHTVPTGFQNLTFILAKTMAYTLTNFTVSFLLNSTLAADNRLVLRFPTDFDSSIGMTNSRGQLPCTSSPNLSPTCTVKYYSLELTINAFLSANSMVTFNIKDVFMPTDINFVQIMLLDSNSSILASALAKPVAVSAELDLRCCITYDVLDVLCDDDLRRVCLKFFFNQAEFEDDMNTILVRFRQAIYIEPLRKLGQNCGNFFLFQTLERLGRDPECRWIDEDRLRIFLGAYPTISNKDKLYFHYGIIQYKNTTRFLEPPRLRLLNPRFLPTPTAVLTQTGFISKCSIVTLDCLQSTGSGRRNLKCLWELDGYQVASGSMFQVGLSYVPSEMRNQANYSMKVVLHVVNEWGNKNSASSTVFYQVNKDIQITFPFGNHIRFYYSREFSFTLMVDISSSCKNVTTDDLTDFRWHSSAPKFPDCKGKICPIPARTLNFGNYTLMVSSEIPGTLLYGSANVTFEVSPTPIRIKTVGGDCLIQVNKSVRIDGSATIDPDRQGDQKVMLEWIVRNGNGVRVYPPDNSTVSGHVLDLYSGMLNESNTRYIVNVTTTSLSGGRKPESIELWLETTAAPVYKIYTLPSPTVNPFDIVKISAVSSTPPGSKCNWIQVTNHNFVMYSDPTHPIFVFKPESFDVGLEYRFKYECETIIGNETLYSRAEVKIYINMPPVGGVFHIEPKQGVDLETNFFLTAQNWMDRDGDYPLYYQYYYMEGDIYRPFSPAMLQNNFSTVLARASQSDMPLTIVLYVCDTLNACTRSSQNVTLASSRRSPTGLIQDTLDKAMKTANTSGDPRAGLTPIGQVPIFIAQSLANGNLTAEQAIGPVTAVMRTIEEATNKILLNNTGPLSTEDQETIAGLVGVSMVPGATNVEIAALGMSILDSVMNLNGTRYTTGPNHALAIDKIQQALAVVPLTEANMDEVVNTTEGLYALTDRLSRQVVDRLTPGQFPTIISLDSLIIGAERYEDSSNTTRIFKRDLTFPINTPQLNGFYNITIVYNQSNGPEMDFEGVMEMVIRALLIPPPEVLLRHLPHAICELNFGNTADYQRIMSLPLCRNYIIAAADNITTIYPLTQLQRLPYNTSTGNISETGTSWYINSGQRVTHILPMANYTGNVTCSAHSSDGLIDNSLCSKGPTTATSVLCSCQNATDAFLSPNIDVGQAVGNIMFGGRSTSDCGEITAGLLFLLWILFVSFILLLFFWLVDKSEEADKAEIVKQFENFIQEVVSYLAKFEGEVKWQKRKWYGCLCRRCFYLPLSVLSIFSCFFRPVPDSLLRLFSLPLEEEGNREKLASAICFAVDSLSKDAQLHIWQEFGALGSFKSRLSSPVFLSHIKALYFQFKTGLRDFSMGSELRRTPVNAGNCFHLLFTDDLMHYKNSLSEFVGNNELLGLVFNRKIAISRARRFPILLVTFLSAVCFYSANYTLYKSQNKQKLLQLGDLLSSSMGQLWTVENWYIVLIIFAISTVIGFSTEKLLVWGCLDPPDMEGMRQRFAHTWAGENKKWKCVACHILFRVIPLLLCAGLYVSSFLSIWQLDKNEIFSIIGDIFQGFMVAGVAVGFFGVGALFTLPYWFKRLYLKATGDYRNEWRKCCMKLCWKGVKYLGRLGLLVVEPVLLPKRLLSCC